MIDFDKELEDILNSDPLGLLQVKPKTSGVATADERLISSFDEITDFVKVNNREPAASTDIGERKLYSRLKGLRNNPEKASSLVDYDNLNLLDGCGVREEPEIYTTEDVMDHDPLGLLSDDPSENILKLKNVSRTLKMPDDVAKRIPCKDFEKYEPLFIDCHSAVKAGKLKLRKFTGEQQIAPGEFFILYGVMVYVAAVGQKVVKRGKANARLRCIFETGTESNMLLRSLATELYKDEHGRRVVDPGLDLYDDKLKVSDEDQVTGYIYVLRSLSPKPEISNQKDLYKIGFSSGPVKERIQNAANEPTYLMADVKLVMEYETYNMDPQKFESLIHRFFAESCLNLDVFDNDGKRHMPREWFVVSLQAIETAVKLLINGEIVHYQYDTKAQEIVPAK